MYSGLCEILKTRFEEIVLLFCYLLIEDDTR